MKILVLPSWYPPNGGRFFKLQSESLVKLGHTVDVLILEEKGITKKRNFKIENKKSILTNEIRHNFYRIPKMNNLNIELFISKYKKLLNKYLANNKPDIIHVHSSIWAGVVVSEIAREKNIPYVITEHRGLFLKDKLPYNEDLILKIKKALDFAVEVLVVSSAVKQKIKKYTSNSITILPNMVDVNFFKPIKKKKKASKISLVSVGNLNKVKGFDLLIKAFANIVATNKNVELKIIGIGEELSNLQDISVSLKIDNFIEFSGYKTKKELLEVYQNADIFISSSRFESFGVVLIEALSCGLPIVATNSGGPADIVKKENGFLAENKNANSLQTKIQLMIDNLSNFDASIIRLNTIANYSEEVISRKLEKHLLECLQHKKQ
tara:strand:- start:7071 stop:8207 length:1137 start_codon:yes stop_codon:yes gene_type:complete